ncbi:MAG: hypothetical protein K0S36_1806 [Nitrosospira multiformis]|nr:hypothetical protein [Nitrosospira multiformis]
MLCRPMGFTLTSALALGAVSAAPACIAAMISATVGGVPEGAAFYENFDSLASTGGTTVQGITISFSGTGAGVASLPDIAGYYAAPIIVEGSATSFGNTQNEGPNETRYLTSGMGQAVMELEGDHQYFGLLWGSTDDHNLLSFYHGDTFLFSFTGLDVENAAGYNEEAAGNFYVNITSEDPFNKVIASSTRYGFEFDNVALGYSPVSLPQEIEEVSEPDTLALVTLGLLVGLSLRRHVRSGY